MVGLLERVAVPEGLQAHNLLWKKCARCHVWHYSSNYERGKRCLDIHRMVG